MSLKFTGPESCGCDQSEDSAVVEGQDHVIRRVFLLVSGKDTTERPAIKVYI